MSYTLLTGATGLLGSYLLRDLLLAGRKVAVIVRRTRRQSAQQRVDEILGHWSQLRGVQEEPVVLDGNITESSLGLNPDARRWVGNNCSELLHSAASLKFQPVGNEPWHSNVSGTEKVIELCEDLNIPNLHYVSTAYVCGKTHGPAYEAPAPSDVEPRNVYEASKCQAERAVLESHLQNQPTIYRPSIIMGDSETGYTSTFHGPYLPLRLAIAFAGVGSGSASTAPAIGLDPRKILGLMGLNGSERKNIVPVDWVSRVICRLLQSPSDHGRIYHLTTSNPLSVEMLTRVTFECVRELVAQQHQRPNEGNKAGGGSPLPGSPEELFQHQLGVYRDYWSDDPVFDATALNLAIRDCPAPVVDEPMLMRSFQFVALSSF